MGIIEIIQTTKMNQGKVYIPKRVQKLLGVKDNESVLWSINENGQIVVSNTKKSQSKYDFISPP